MKCPQCVGDLIWGGDSEYEDYKSKGVGIVSSSSCPDEKCSVETVLIYTN